MANRDLLAEAIADAKAVKATAIANAKAALEEAFTPHLKSMLAAKLEEMDRDDDMKEEELEEMDAPSFKRKSGASLDPDPKKVGQTTVQEEEELEEDLDLDEILSELDLDESISEEVTEEIDEDLTEAEEEESEEEESEEGEGEMEEEIDLEDMSEDDLKSFIEDVIKDMVSAGELEAGEEFEAEDEMEMGDEEIDMEDDSEEIMENEEVDMEEGYNATDEMDGTPIDEEELEEVVDPVTVAAGVAALLGGSAALNKAIDKAEAGGYGDKAKKLADFLRKSGKAAGDAMREETLNEEPVSMSLVAAGVAALLGGSVALNKAMEKAEKGDYGDKAKKLAAMLRKGGKAAGDVTQQRGVTEEDITSALSEIEELRKELQEVNLLNAKLLYSNKIFRTKNLSEDKKVKVLKAFDRAASVKDAKVIFDTLNENLNSKEVKKSMVSEIKASASKSAGVATQAKQPIVENDAFRRMQQLAGIIKEN